jgi:hypothetical protein
LDKIPPSQYKGLHDVKVMYQAIKAMHI